MENFDQFGQPIENFNIKGKTKMNTLPGLLMSVLVLLMFTAYSLTKLTHLFNRHNPLIAQTELQNFYSSENVVKLEEINFNIAWGVEGYLDRVAKDDEEFVEWEV